MFGDNQTAKRLCEGWGAWGGNCFGMSMTSCQIFRKITSAASFRSGAEKASELSVTDRSSSLGYNLTTYIEACQISQGSSYKQKVQNSHRDNLDALVSAVKSGGPVIVSIRGKDDEGDDCGHAMVAYAVTEASPTTHYLELYDPNFRQQIRRITLGRNSSGKYTSWYYHLNDDYHWGTGYSSACISYFTAEDMAYLWNNRGRLTDSY